MKNILKIVALLLLTILTHSCFKEDSSLDLDTIQGVEIDTTGMSSLSVYQFENLVVKPDLKYEDLPENRLSYEWKINLTSDIRDTVYQVLSEERNLDAPIAFKPTNSGKFHQLVYTVSDEKTGIDYIMQWPVKVLNNIGEGIVVAETNDGTTSDLSHIMSPQVTTDYDQVSIKHHVFSSINGSTIPGITKQLKYFKIYGENALLGITDEMIYKINTFDYTLNGTNDDLFYVPQESYKPQALGQVNQGSLFINDGRLTSTYFGASRKFGTPYSSAFTVPSILAGNVTQGPPITLSFYDESIDEFVYQPSITAFGDNNMYKTPSTEDGAFDPTAIPNRTNLAASSGTNGDFRHLLKDESTGAIGLYIFDGGEFIFPDAIPPTPLAYYDLSNAPEIAQAKYFAFVDNQKILYYATSTKIYAVIYASSTAQVQERYSIPAGEEVTTLQVYQQGDYPFRSSEDYLPLNNKALLMSTYNGSEGKVYLLPFINTGIGNIDTANIQTYEGFDKITALGTQL